MAFAVVREPVLAPAALAPEQLSGALQALLTRHTAVMGRLRGDLGAAEARSAALRRELGEARISDAQARACAAAAEVAARGREGRASREAAEAAAAAAEHIAALEARLDATCAFAANACQVAAPSVHFCPDAPGSLPIHAKPAPSRTRIIAVKSTCK